jgi:RimJ/RimL family protein N-acetyltransferase
VRLVENEAIAGFIEQKLQASFSPPYTAFGFVSDDGRPLCAVLFNDFNHSNMEMTIYAEPGGITRQVLRYLAHYVFNKSQCRRLTVRTKKRNKRVLQLAPRYGFKYECIAKHFFADDDAVVFRMLKEDCRFL